MRRSIVASVIVCLAANVAAAERGGVTVKVKHYEISGETPRDMFLSMVKRGPKDGFRSRAIAQTQYHTDWSTTLRYADGACRVISAEPRATITYIYPQRPGGMSPAVKRRWDRFMKGIVRHERQHGRYVHAMLAEAKKSISGLKIDGDEQCRRTRAEMKRRVSRIHDLYEAKQRAFDEREHRDGANIDRLIKAFVNE